MSAIEQIAEEVSTLMPMIARRVLMEYFQSVTLTQAQIFTIMALYERAPVRLSELGRKMHITAPTVTGIVDRLERSGYVRRAPDAADRRAVHVGLTLKGRKAARRLKSTLKEKWHGLLEKLSEPDRKHFVSILRKIQRGIE